MRRPNQSDSIWISFSDLMTGLMVVFMFIAINYILQIIEYKFVENEIYNSLQEKFTEEISDSTVELSPDGTIRLKPGGGNTELFVAGAHDFTPEFDALLSDFIPKYIEVITSSDNLDFISEIRIEGHTDTLAVSQWSKNNPARLAQIRELGLGSREAEYIQYESNLELSQRRANAVLSKIRSDSNFVALNDTLQRRLEFLFTSNGLSTSRVLTDAGEYYYLEKAISQNVVHPNNDRSRRVEFRIVTSNDSLASMLTQGK